MTNWRQSLITSGQLLTGSVERLYIAAPSVKRARSLVLALLVGTGVSVSFMPQSILIAQEASAATKKSVAKRKTVVSNPALSLGISNYQRGYIQKAIPPLEKAVQQAPNNLEAALWLARAYQKQGWQNQAKSAYAHVLAIDSYNVEALTVLGELYTWDLSKRAEGVTLLQRAYQQKPGDEQIAKKLSEALLWENRLDEAYAVASPVAGYFGSDKKWLSSYAQILTRSGHAADAVYVYENQLNIVESRDLTQLQGYATALYQSGQTARAEQVYQSIKPYANELGPEKGVEIKKALAGLAFDLGLYSEAVSMDQSLPEPQASAKETRLRIARALVRADRNPEAVDVFYQLYKAGQLSSTEKLEVADYLQTQSLTDATLPEPGLIDTLYQQAINEDRANVDAALRLAQRYRNTTSFDQADRYYQQAWELASQHAPAKTESVQTEYLDFLKTNKTDLLAVEARFKALMQAAPNNPNVQGAYAEFLSYQPNRHAESLRIYLALTQSDLEQSEHWKSELDKVLGWHQADTDLIPLYQEVVNTFPNDKAIWQGVGRAYAANPDYYSEALDLYARMLQKFPQDQSIRKEWIDLLASNPKRRDEAIATLRQYVGQQTEDVDARVALGKLLSYKRYYGESLQELDTVLSKDPQNKDALVAKGYTLMWSGKKLQAKAHFIETMKVYPDDLDVAVGLAQANKFLGRYDEAFDVMRRVRPQINHAPSRQPQAEFIPCASITTVQANTSGIDFGQPVWDVSVLPGASPNLNSTDSSIVQTAYAPTQQTDDDSGYALMQTPVEQPSVQNETQAELQSDIESLDAAIESLNALQASSSRQLNQLKQTVNGSKDHLTTQTNVGEAQGNGYSVSTTGEMIEQFAIFSSLGYDTNPLLSGLGRFKNGDLANMERGLQNDLRPMFRAGYSFDTKTGEDTTSRLSSWGFPNQLAISLSPQIRARFGVNPFKYYIPSGNARSPFKTWSEEYLLGVTAKLSDRFTFTGDMALTHFNQSKSNNITYDASVTYDINDEWRIKLGSRRVPQFNSLLSVAGLRPSQGAFAGNLVGQSRETGVYGEVNWNPTVNWDVNLGYEWAFVDGEQTPTNYKNQVFFSPGYTWQYADNHKVRLGYEFLFMNYARNTNVGYFDTTANGSRLPQAGLNPPVLAADGYDFGGYFSPKWFFQNAGRLDFRGAMFDQFLEYKLGGSLGVQTFNEGHGISPSQKTALTASADLNLITNVTDWLSLYAFGEYLKAGSVFSRWRFGGGVILRPRIDFLSPVFGRSDTPPAEEESSSIPTNPAATSSKP